MKHTIGDLRQRQSLPLEAKVQMTKQRIREWYEHYDGQVYVSFSGGKDSTVLLNIARQIYPDIEAVFVDTGLEYPEIRKFVKSFDNVTILRPKMSFVDVIKKVWISYY
jgi:3'-phosphoadenosine 5'-phosphosulfate sulfotransferase (PAPS reductase)/FAD synthetase